MSLNLVEFSKALSHKLHEGQFRRDKVTPYTVHTDYVGDNVHKFLSPDVADSTLHIAMSVGYLHDTIEDVLRSPEALMELGKDMPFWSTVVTSVNKLSRMSKTDPIIPYLEVIAADGITQAVKRADLFHNMSDLAPGNLRDKYQLCQYFLLLNSVEA